MPRMKQVIRPVEKHISLPENLVAMVEVELYSEIEGKVPFGAWKNYVEDLIRKDLKEKGILQ